MIRKPGQAASAPASTDTKVTRGTGSRPSGTVSKQETATVTIKAIDAEDAVAHRPDGGRPHRQLPGREQEHIEGVAVGDKVEVTYTKADGISVK